MTTPSLAQQLRDATASPAPAHARERVWRQLQQPAPARSWRWRVVASAAAAAVLAFVTLRAPAPLPLVAIGADGFVTVATAGTLTRRGEALSFDRGDVLVSSWGGPVALVAGTHHVSSDAAVFALRVAADQLVVSVEQGAVIVDGERVTARAKTFTPDLAPLYRAEPPFAATERAWALAERAAADGRIDEAVERFGALAATSPLRAEAALLRKAQLELWNLHDAAAALSTLAQATRRFPDGALQQEVALSQLEALSATKDFEATRAAAAAFLARYPDSERRDEVNEFLNAARAADIQPANGRGPHGAPK